MGSLLCLSLTPLLAHAQSSARFEDIGDPAPVPVRTTPRPAQASTKPDSEAGSSSGTCPKVDYRVRRARRLLAERRALLAMGELSRAITEDPRCGEAYLKLARLRAGLADYAEAELLYAKALRLPTVADEALRARSLMRRMQGRTSDALHDLEAYAALAPNDASRLEALATVYIEIKAWSAALATYRRIVNVHEAAARDSEAQSARIKVKALSLLAAETDPVRAGADRNWVRGAMAQLAKD